MLRVKSISKLIRRRAKAFVYWRMYRWLSRNERDLAEYLGCTDGSLWEETQNYMEEMSRSSTEQLVSRSITVGLPDQGVGGGAECGLLYFLVRHTKPATVVETGVSMGWSSRAILDAMAINGVGHLYSTDLPYSHRPGREDVGVSADDVGCLVPEQVRDRWTLYLGPDREYLPQILAQVERIDLFHYDSDKSYQGRRWAMDQVRDKMRPPAIILMDDIKDNPFFMHHVGVTSRRWRILREGASQRWVGMIEV